MVGLSTDYIVCSLNVGASESDEGLVLIIDGGETGQILLSCEIALETGQQAKTVFILKTFRRF